MEMSSLRTQLDADGSSSPSNLGSNHMPTGDNYYSLISRAIAELQPNTNDARLAMYERARTSLDEDLATSNQTTGTIFRERQSLERAIRRVENMHANADKVQLAWSSKGLKKWLDYQVAD